MKKIIIAMAAIAAAFTMASCNKEPLVEPEKNITPTEGNCIITASTESALTKTGLIGDDAKGYEVVWSEGDSFKIGDKTFTLTAGDGTTNGTFKGDAPADGNYTVYYPSTYNGSTWPVSQTYSEGNITGSPMKAEVTITDGKASEPIKFTNEGGILRLTVKGSANISVASIIVSAKGLNDISLNCGDGVSLDETNGTVFHIAMPEGIYPFTSILLLAKGGKSCVKSLKSKDLVIDRSKITPASFSTSFTSTAPDGALSEAFTVSADGKMVFFSKGNLWCDTDANPAASNFHFEDNQYDTTPKTNTDRDNRHISHFMWCSIAADAVKANYSETSKSADDILFTNATGFTVNGAGNWYAPSHDEMDYLLTSRKASTVGDTANARYFSGRIDKDSGNYVNGLFVIPDIFTWPESELPNAPKGINEYRYNYTDNTYSVSEFAVLQQAGVVFMPCAGSRDGYSGYSSVNYVNNSGYYWYSTLKDADNARHLGFSVSGSILEDSANNRNQAYSIRLVTDLADNPTQTFTVSFDMNDHGTAPADITGVQYRATITNPNAIPSAAGFAFAGWYKDKGCNTKWNFESDVVTANTTLYAGWIEKPDGALSGLFSVADDKQVFFSKGNLLWYGYAGRDYFAMSGNQWGSEPTFSGGWTSTSVYHFFWIPNRMNMSLSHQKDYTYYEGKSNDILFTNASANTATAYSFTVKIDNNDRYGWRTLSGGVDRNAEWYYLINVRTVNGGQGEGHAYSNAVKLPVTIDGTEYKGLFIYPDDYTGTVVGVDETTDSWAEINAAGIVFLPAAGRRNGDRVEVVGMNGNYWASTTANEKWGYRLFFSSSDVTPHSTEFLQNGNGYSIRLVTDVSGSPTPTYTVTFNANGHGTAPETLKNVLYGSTINKPEDLTAMNCDFTGWYTDKDCKNKWDFDSDIVAGNTTLYAGWFKWPDGSLSGMFTVAEGKQVHFSQGNLYYDGANWGFESEQFYFRTYSGEGKYDVNGYNEEGTANGHWGLFGWPISTNNYGMSTSTDNSNYSGTFNDWGNAIDNKGTWRTLTSAEWKYLFETRPDAENKYGFATVRGQKGIIIIPDEFTDPMKNYGSNAFVPGSSSISWINNVYNTTENWELMESAGAIFLPAAGRRSGTGIAEVECGSYWSSSAVENTSNANYVYFNINLFGPNSKWDLFRGHSVRLVTDVK